MKELTELFEAPWHQAAHVPHAVATVLRVEGSSYRRPGARMLVDVHGRVAGSVSGGCLEKSVISQAQATLLDGCARLLSFDTTDQDDLAFGSSLGCQGKIWIGIEFLAPGKEWPLEAVVRQVCEQREPAALLTHIFRQDAEIHFECTAFSGASPDTKDIPEVLRDKMDEVLCTHKNQFVGEDASDSTLIEWLAPPIALVLFGGGPDVPPMVKLARELGHKITVIERRPLFAIPEQFPGAHRVLAAKPYQIRALLKADDRTVAVLMNHHYDTDRDVLAALLPLDLPYIAMLGPRRRTERILAELQEMDFTVSEKFCEALHAPAGLDLGAESPEQIALSILAEIQATLANREGGKLKFRTAPIHAEIASRKNACAILA